eukprot:4429467-Karenia_brevis.AAC.1
MATHGTRLCLRARVTLTLREHALPFIARLQLQSCRIFLPIDPCSCRWWVGLETSRPGAGGFDLDAVA